MKFIIDAHLPYQLKNWLMNNGEDVIHTRDLPKEDLTDDFEIISFSMKEKRVVISKDRDFYEYFIVNEKPDKLLWLTIENIKNKDLINLFQKNYFLLKNLLEEKTIVELSQTDIIVHF